MSTLGRWIRSTTLIVLATALAGCDLFKPAVPEPPGGNVEPPVVDLLYGDPDQTLNTIAAAIKAKDLGNGRSAYLLSFADPAIDSVPPYTAGFDTADVRVFLQSTGRDSVGIWTRDLEKSFYAQFSTLRRAPYDMRWYPWDAAGRDEHGEQTATLHRMYKVYAVSGDASILIAVGLVDLIFQKSPRVGDNEKWVILRWEDHIDPAQPPNPTENITFGSRRLKTLR